ncbi:MAG: universal stress protein [Pirellulaceae bacterium]|nr:MAG: universal stress protein [Pirellulaceae bacterium]
MEWSSILVPVDLSPISEEVVRQAVALATGEQPVVILLHVIDTSLIEFAASHQFGSREEIVERMKQRAYAELKRLQELGAGRVEVDILVCEGTPFVQIVQKAQDFLCDAIVMGKVGGRGLLEKLLFGSTAEKVLRASPCPVVVLPIRPADTSAET